jgi:hypothetical protein
LCLFVLLVANPLRLPSDFLPPQTPGNSTNSTTAPTSTTILFHLAAALYTVPQFTRDEHAIIALLPQEPPSMANAYDPYREALVVETLTLWSEEYDGWDEATKARIEKQLQSNPQAAAEMDYERLHTGFCRKITVTPEDLQRLK